MRIDKQTTYLFKLDPDELGAIALAVTSYTAPLGTAAKAEADAILAALTEGKPLNAEQTDDLRVYLIRVCKSKSSGDSSEWPGLLGEIARHFQNRL